jgi:hypothetical protein
MPIAMVSKKVSRYTWPPRSMTTRAYFPVYRDAVDRWGKDAKYGYSWPLFEHCYYLSQLYPEHIKLWLMIVDEHIIGGRIAFYWNQQVTGWNGTAYREFLNHNVMPVADTEIIRDAIARGFRYMDFNTSGGNQGVIDYKKRFGSVAIPVNMWIYKHPLYKIYKAGFNRALHFSGLWSAGAMLPQAAQAWFAPSILESQIGRF